ncbi:MAG: IclR family transcriptional regulator [Veillonellales bacterium]
MVLNNSQESQVIQSVDRAITLLLELSEVPRDVDLAELSKKTGLTKSTASRLLSTMQKRGLVRQNPTTRRFSLGTGLIRLGNIALGQIWRPETFRSYLEQLVSDTGETASIAIRDGYKAVYIDQVASYNMIRSFPPIGATVDLHSTAVGKVLLSGLTPAVILKTMSGYKLTANTEKTITDLNVLLEVISHVREQGFAVEYEETELGGCCLAAPILDNDSKVIAAIGISGPIIRITPERIAVLSEIVKAAATELSAEFGYKNKNNARG